MRASCIYTGHVRHRRFVPVSNEFEYRLFLLYIDLSELPRLFDGRWLWSVNRPNVATFRRADYFGDPDLPLESAVREAVAHKTGTHPEGPIRMLTHLRYYGYIFNPVTFYYCFDQAGTRVETIVAQITNTPWQQRHAYVLSDAQNEGRGLRKRYRFGKQFHVSPFNPMDMDYDWRFSNPGETLNVHMICSRHQMDEFDATLRLTRREITPASLAGVLFTYPMMTSKVITMIHWQALHLWLKRSPYYQNPVSKHGVRSVS